MKERYKIKLKEIIKGITWKKVFYPTLISIFALIIIVLFIFSVRFISKSINRVFINEESIEGQLPRLELDSYLPVAKKLGIPINTFEPSQELGDEFLAEPQIHTPSDSSATSSQDTIDNIQSLKIAIYNSTDVLGLAQNLKNILKEKGFEVTETGNTEKTGDYTLIKIKESKKDSLAEVKTIVGEHYNIGESPFLSEDNGFDVIIIIGDK